MKVVLAGSTGFIGGAVLERLVVTPEVTSIIAVTRRELSYKNSKVRNIIVKDFKDYDKDTKDQLLEADACIWCLGKPSDGKEVHYDFTLTAMKVFEESLENQSRAKGKPFRFIYTSGSLGERNQDAKLWLLPGTRKMRGQCEAVVVETQGRHPEQWQSFVVRPALVSKGEPLWSSLIRGYHIPVGELAAAMVDVALNGRDIQTIENSDLRLIGQAALGQTGKQAA